MSSALPPARPLGVPHNSLKKLLSRSGSSLVSAGNAPFLVCGQTGFVRKAKRNSNQTVTTSQEEPTHMKVNQWTLGLAAAGVISFGAVAQAEEKPSNQVLTAVSSTQISGYVSTSAHWNPGQSTGFAGDAGSSYLAGKGDGFNLDVIQLTISKPLAVQMMIGTPINQPSQTCQRMSL